MTRTTFKTAELARLSGDLIFVMVETADGERFVHPHAFSDKRRAERLLDRVTAAGSIDANLWNTHYPRYGSPAHQREELEAWEWATAIRNGLASEDAAPDHIRALI
jgi:hypothetical protein